MADFTPNQSTPPTDPPRPGAGHAAIAATQVVCSDCGYNLTGVSIGGSCPECGRSVDESLSVSAMPISGCAIASMVLGICSAVTSVLVCMCVGPIVSMPCAIAGLICWAVARRGIRSGRVSPASARFNLVGLITNLFGLIIGLLFIGMIVFALLTNNTAHTSTKTSSGFGSTPPSNPPSMQPVPPATPGPRP